MQIRIQVKLSWQHAGGWKPISRKERALKCPTKDFYFKRKKNNTFLANICKNQTELLILWQNCGMFLQDKEMRKIWKVNHFWEKENIARAGSGLGLELSLSSRAWTEWWCFNSIRSLLRTTEAIILEKLASFFPVGLTRSDQIFYKAW